MRVNDWAEYIITGKKTRKEDTTKYAFGFTKTYEKFTEDEKHRFRICLQKLIETGSYSLHKYNAPSCGICNERGHVDNVLYDKDTCLFDTEINMYCGGYDHTFKMVSSWYNHTINGYKLHFENDTEWVYFILLYEIKQIDYLCKKKIEDKKTEKRNEEIEKENIIKRHEELKESLSKLGI